MSAINPKTQNNNPSSVAQLLKVATTLSISEKVRIRDLGCPQPNFQLKNVQLRSKSDPPNKTTKSGTIFYATKIYREFDWTCGDFNKKLIYCFPCLLMEGSVKTYQTRCAALHHSKTKEHAKNALNLAMLGKGTIVLNGLSGNGIRKTHNDTVKKNRQLLLRIITGFIQNANLYEYVLSSKNRLKPLTFMELLNRVDNTLQECYKYSPLFSYMKLHDIEEEILIAALSAYQSVVLEEVNSAKYVAVIIEETTDLEYKDQLVIILRYILDDRVVERFWSFVKPLERNAATFAKQILNELDLILGTQKEKLIAQSHIGGVVFSPLISDVHRLITAEYKNAIYVHYHAYKLTEYMERSVCQNSRVRDFFANLYGVFQFFKNEPKVQRAFLDAAPIYSEGSFEKGALVFIYENKTEILNFMILLHTDLESSAHLIREADVCEKLLMDDNFVYFLSFFYYLMADVNVFYESLQNSLVDSEKIAQAINEFLDEIQKTKDAIAVENSDNDDKASEPFLRAFAKIEICNVILKEIQERFRFSNHWEAHILFKSEQYYKFHGNFPEKILANATEYFQFNQPEKLRVELETLYTRSDLMVCRNAHELLWVFHHYKLKHVFDKTTALLHVILTIPTMMIEAENKICAVKRVRRAAAVAPQGPTSSALTMLLSEQETLPSFKNFADRILDAYVSRAKTKHEFTYC